MPGDERGSDEHVWLDDMFACGFAGQRGRGGDDVVSGIVVLQWQRPGLNIIYIYIYIYINNNNDYFYIYLKKTLDNV